jgi:hypothetical protein
MYHLPFKVKYKGKGGLEGVTHQLFVSIYYVECDCAVPLLLIKEFMVFFFFDMSAQEGGGDSN